MQATGTDELAGFIERNRLLRSLADEAIDTAQMDLNEAHAEVERLSNLLQTNRDARGRTMTEIRFLARALAYRGAGIKLSHFRDSQGAELPFHVRIRAAFCSIDIQPWPTSRSGKTQRLEARPNFWGLTGTVPTLPFEQPKLGTSSATKLAEQFAMLVSNAKNYLADYTAEQWLDRYFVTIPSVGLESLIDFRITTTERSAYQMGQRITWFEPQWEANLAGVLIASYSGGWRDKDLGIDRETMPDPADSEATVAWAEQYWPVVKPALLRSLREEW